MSSEYAIEINDLSKCYEIYNRPIDRLRQTLFRGRKKFYKEFWALKDVSFKINKGETVGIIGRNGSGKSTLLQMICGTLNPTNGQIETRGRVAALLELGAGFNSEFTGRENVLLNADILGFPREVMSERMKDIIAFSELNDFLDQPVKTYSSGMYARLAFSIAIHVDPDILIIDEALAVGDARFVAKCMRRIKDIQKQGATVLFVSHDVGSVRTLCERAIWLHQGRLVAQGDVFPVTGQFMEFMFKSEIADKDAQNETSTLPAKTLSSETQIPVCIDKTKTSEHEGISTKENTDIEDAGQDLDARPVTHWGSHKGMILSASVRHENGTYRNVFDWGQGIEIVIELNIPREIPREDLSVAFSIKDLKGTDLIVSTTRDLGDTRLPSEERFAVSFSLTNHLVTGRYLLVAAVENRQYRDIHYYEFIEGAHYFASSASQRFFGVFQPKITQMITTKNDHQSIN